MTNSVKEQKQQHHSWNIGREERGEKASWLHNFCTTWPQERNSKGKKSLVKVQKKNLKCKQTLEKKKKAQLQTNLHIVATTS